MIEPIVPSIEDSRPVFGVGRERRKRRGASASSPASRFYRYQKRLGLDPRQRRKMARKAALADLRTSYGPLVDICGTLTAYAHPQRASQGDGLAIASDWRSVGNSLRRAIDATEVERRRAH